MIDPIVEEVRRIRDAHAAQFHYDLDAIFLDLKEREKKSGHPFVDGVARPAVPSPMTPPTEAAITVSGNSKLPQADPMAEF